LKRPAALDRNKEPHNRVKKTRDQSVHTSCQLSRAIGQPVILSSAAQVSVLVGNVPAALVVVVQLCVVPIAIRGLATSVKIIAACPNFLAGLDIGAIRAIHVLVSARAAVSGGYAAEVAVIIDDLAPALLDVIQAGIVPLAVYGLAAGLEIIPVALDVFASLSIRSAGHACRISTLVAWIAVRRTNDAPEVAVIVQDVSTTLVIVIQLGFMPTAIAGLAARMKIVTTDMDVLARLRIRAIGPVPALISAWRSITVRGAA
jgi:hypothetical protein